MKDKHTPGPWRVSKNDSIYAKDEFIGIALSGKPWGRELPQEANARLMAAAPEMKAKLDEMAEFLRIVYVCIPEEITGTCARQITNWGILKQQIEGDE